MVKANELRIGNMVLLSDGTPITVSSINHEGIELFCDLDEVRDEVVSANYEFKALEAIPLTEEWLRNLGFKSEYGRSTGDTFSMEKGRICLFELPKGWHYNVKGDYGDIHIQHVHQLQNLYFALTGEELEVKE